jgi:predicted CXXCH cytochrome family protein
VTRTKHNLSSVPPDQILSSSTQPRPGTSRDVFSLETTEICVFCHTPHGANSTAASQLRAPIWNRNLSQASYQLYDQVWSRSFEGKLNPGAPTGYSRLCLSCHDGTIALGALRNAPGSGGFNLDPTQNPPIQMTYAPGVTPPFPSGTIPEGSGSATGNTRRLGTDLRNDHAISFVFDDALASVDKELVFPGGEPIRPANEALYPSGIGPMRRYDGETQGVYDSVQCTSCHNPHQVNYPKFLRANWLQNAPEHSGEQIICLFCHDKPGWIESTHSVATAIRSKYPIVNGNPDDLTSGYDYDGDHSVGQYACRNCHDPHTAQGAKRLHREGIDTPGGLDAIENTCYLCHAPNTQPVSPLFAPAGDPTTSGMHRFCDQGQPGCTNFGGGRIAPDIYSQFAKDRSLGGTGSAMNLRLAQGHEPVFTSYPREGVELDSPGIPPPFNKFAPGSPGGSAPPPDSSPDPRHIECVDCHNPHQVVSTNRLKGMRGITFNHLVVGHDSQGTGCQPGPCNREPYVYEVCFRCHGNSVTNLFAGDRFPEDTNYRSNPLVTATNPSLSMPGFSNKRLEFATYGVGSQEVSATANPQTGSYVDGQVWGTPDGGALRRVGPGVNKAFHPVVAPGRNRTPALDRQLRQGSNQRLSVNSTIHCTDCHNNDRYDAFNGNVNLTPNPTFQGPLTESNLRGTDSPNPGTLQVYNTRTQEVPNDLNQTGPIGPHGSTHIRILRANYNTDISNPTRDFQNNGFNQPAGPDAPFGDHFNNFVLCFQCHAREAFDPSAPGADPNETTPTPWTNFFGSPVTPNNDPGLADPGKRQPGQLSWESNLHMYHLVRTGAYCHECHYNIHSNAQATNTIYGDGTGCIGGTLNCTIGLPPDEEDGITDGVSDTHLINFAPGGPTNYGGERKCDDSAEGSGADTPCVQFTPGPADPNLDSVTVATRYNIFEGVEGVTADRPVWYFDASFNPPRFRCNLRCHGVVMSTCFYITTTTPGYSDMTMNPGAANDANTGWCAGGRTQQAPINFGALPPEVKDLMAKMEKEHPSHDNLPSPLRQYMANLEQSGDTITKPADKSHE